MKPDSLEKDLGSNLDSSFLHNWHPCSQMKDYESFPVLKVKEASGSTITLNDGTQLIDTLSSWWCKPLGHRHPRLIAALKEQLNHFEHVMFANLTHDLAIQLGEKLTSYTQNLKKVFYACDGSTAIEIALKMSLQSHLQNGSTKKKKFAYLKNAYHGETLLCYSVSDLELYKSKFTSLLPEQIKLTDFTYEHGALDDEFQNKAKDKIDYEKLESSFSTLKQNLDQNKEELAGIIVEPLVQGAAGMLIYSPDVLKMLRVWSKNNDVHLIADEIMTGLGRTGGHFAIDLAGIEPDFLCVMKGLSAGVSPFSAVLTKKSIYDQFYDTYESGQGFMHSNTFSGHSLGFAAALETLKILEDENHFENNKKNGKNLYKAFEEINQKTDSLKNIRQLGFIAAADLININNVPRLGYQIYKKAISNGLLIRPLGNTIYLLPPFNLSDKDLEKIVDGTVRTIKEIL